MRWCDGRFGELNPVAIQEASARTCAVLRRIVLAYTMSITNVVLSTVLCPLSGKRGRDRARVMRHQWTAFTILPPAALMAGRESARRVELDRDLIGFLRQALRDSRRINREPSRRRADRNGRHRSLTSRATRREGFLGQADVVDRRRARLLNSPARSSPSAPLGRRRQGIRPRHRCPWAGVGRWFSFVETLWRPACLR